MNLNPNVLGAVVLAYAMANLFALFVLAGWALCKATRAKSKTAVVTVEISGRIRARGPLADFPDDEGERAA